MTAPSSILLFAAGLGTRMGTLVVDRPKPLVQVAGKTLLDRTLALTVIPSIKTRVINVHYKAAMIRDHLAGQDIKISDETDLLRETGGGLRHATPILGNGPVITMNTDAVWAGTNPILQLLAAWNPMMEALLMLVPQERTMGHKGSGDFYVGPDKQLTRGSGDIYTGLQIIRTHALDAIEDECFSMNLVWDQIAKRQGLYGITYDGQWCDVGQPESIPIAENMLATHANV